MKILEQSLTAAVILLFLSRSVLSLAAESSNVSAKAVDEILDEDCRPEDWERSRSQQTFRKGNLLVKPDRSNKDGFKVYRSGRLLLHQSLSFDQMWLDFAYLGRKARTTRSFDGGRRDFISRKTSTAASPFMDFNGDGVPDLVIARSEGNSGNSYSIYSLGTRARKLGTIRPCRAGAEFMDVDNDGRCEVLTYDPTFFGWKTCNAESKMPFVILKMSKDRFKLSTSLMKTKPPDLQRQEQLISKWRTECEAKGAERQMVSKNKGDFCLAPKVWGDMLDLIYSGNSRTAFNLLNKFWRKQMHALNLEYKDCEDVRTSKQQFKALFFEQLSRSPLFPQLKQLNPDDPGLQKIRKIHDSDEFLPLR